MYTEKQSFWTWWMALLLLFLVYMNIGFQEQSTIAFSFANLQIAPGFWIILPIIVLFVLIRLYTEINQEGIRVRFFPLLLKPKLYRWSEIADIYVKEYNPITEYGGWGYRRGHAGKAFNVKGKIGLQLIFKDGSKLLIGTQNKATLEALVNQIKDNNLYHEPHTNANKSI